MNKMDVAYSKQVLSKFGTFFACYLASTLFASSGNTVFGYSESLERFGRHPIDSNPHEGEHASFTCTVIQFNPRTDKLTWHVHPDVYRTLISDHYNRSTLHFTSSITVYTVGRRDQSFKCVLRSLNDGYVLQTFSSKVATMHVQYFPTDDEISCGPNPEGELHEGVSLNIWCKVQEGSPSVNLSWKIRGFNSPFTEGIDPVPDGDTLFLNQEIHIGPELHSKTLECVASDVTRVFHGRQITCSIGPFLVRHIPQVHLTHNLILGQAELRCVASGYPEIERYVWYCSPANILTGCYNVTSETIQLSIAESTTAVTELNVAVTCSVTNAEGTAAAEFTLPLKSASVGNLVSGLITSTSTPSQNDVVFCQNETLKLNLLNESVNWDVLLLEAHLVCYLDCLGQTDGRRTSMTWFLNGHKIEYDNNHIQYFSSPSASYIFLRKVFRRYEISIVSCEAISNNDTYRTSLNLTLLMSLGSQFKLITNQPSGKYTSEDVRQQSIFPSANKIQKKKNNHINDDNQFLDQPGLTTSARNIEEGKTEIDQATFPKFSGIQVIVFTAVAILVGLLLTTCLCAFCTVSLFKYWQMTNTFDNPRCRRVSANFVSCNLSQQKSSLNQSDKCNSNEDTLYEKPITPSPSPHVLSSNIAHKDNLSPDAIISYQCSDSITSSICSSISSDISVPSEYSEWSGQMPSELQEDVDLGYITCTSTGHVYDNSGIIRVHMFPRSTSLSRLPRQNDKIETDFPPPALPGSGAKESSRL